MGKTMDRFLIKRNLRKQPRVYGTHLWAWPSVNVDGFVTKFSCDYVALGLK